MTTYLDRLRLPWSRKLAASLVLVAKQILHNVIHKRWSVNDEWRHFSVWRLLALTFLREWGWVWWMVFFGCSKMIQCSREVSRLSKLMWNHSPITLTLRWGYSVFDWRELSKSPSCLKACLHFCFFREEGGMSGKLKPLQKTKANWPENNLNEKPFIII